MSSFDRSRSLGYMTNWAARLLTKAIDRRLKPLGLSPGHLPVFFALAGQEAMTQKALAEAAAIEQPTMAATLARMERDGLLVRRPDPSDRRSALVSLSEEARSRAVDVLAAVEAVNGIALSRIPDADRARLVDLLADVVAALGADLDGASPPEDAGPDEKGGGSP